jgi:hypothetical protein
VISKKDILKELSDLARKQLARKRKFALVNNGLKKSGKVVNESSDIEIELTGKQVKELDSIFKEFGSDLNAVLQSNLDEKFNLNTQRCHRQNLKKWVLR